MIIEEGEPVYGVTEPTGETISQPRLNYPREVARTENSNLSLWLLLWSKRVSIKPIMNSHKWRNPLTMLRESTRNEQGGSPTTSYY